MGLYHRALKNWDKNWDYQSTQLIKTVGTLSNHMWGHIDNPNKKHDIDLTKLFQIVSMLKRCENLKPFEVEVVNGNVIKSAIRIEYDVENDIIVVFRKGKVVTAYLNRKDDKHKTLDIKKYDN